MAQFPRLHVFGITPEAFAGYGVCEAANTAQVTPELPLTLPLPKGADVMLFFGEPAFLMSAAACTVAPVAPPVVVVSSAQAVMPDWVFEHVDAARPADLLPALRRAGQLGLCRLQLQETRARGLEVTTRFNALAGSIPGLMFQMQWIDDGLSFFFSSGGSQQLLGLPPGSLLSNGSCFLEMLEPADRPEFVEALNESAYEGGQINWEGRIKAPEGDVKWINVRGSTRILADGTPVWEGVMLNITRGKRAELQLRESRRQLAELSNHLQYAKEDERERIAREVHDLLGGHLVALKFEMSYLAGSKEGADGQRRQNIGRLIDEAIETVGRVTRELRPGILRDFGLPAAIECHAEDFSARTGITCHVACDDDLPELPEMVAITLFRILQEALTNIMKHASASTVDVALTQRDGSLVLMVNDNGSGIATADLDKPRSFGLRGMKERIASLGGTLDISRIGVRGTRLEVSLPMSNLNIES